MLVLTNYVYNWSAGVHDVIQQVKHLFATLHVPIFVKMNIGIRFDSIMTRGKKKQALLR